MIRAEVGLEKAKNRDRILREFTGPAKIKALKGDVEIAHLNQIASKMTFELEVEKAKNLERQIASYAIVAPRDGRLLYGVESLFEGKVVGGGHLFTIVPADDSSPKDH